MSTVKPLDPTRWIVTAPKVSSKDVPDPPGFSFVSERGSGGSVATSGASNKEILEKVW